MVHAGVEESAAGTGMPRHDVLDTWSWTPTAGPTIKTAAAAVCGQHHALGRPEPLAKLRGEERGWVTGKTSRQWRHRMSKESAARQIRSAGL
jgi:hypothetical protein